MTNANHVVIAMITMDRKAMMMMTKLIFHVKIQSYNDSKAGIGIMTSL